jgi:hypothetical protein
VNGYGDRPATTPFYAEPDFWRDVAANITSTLIVLAVVVVVKRSRF